MPEGAAPGAAVLHYEFLDKLGEGGMGAVWKARDTRLNRVVAIKVMTPAAEGALARKRFLQEARTASALNHPNIITIHDILEKDGTDYLVMELVSGQPLSMVIPDNGLPPDKVIQYGTAIGAALSAAHAIGIIHRDLKPANVMVTYDDGIKLLDFGLAKFDPLLQTGAEDVTRSLLTQQGQVSGTVAYMSPEQAEGRQVDTRSDIFAFGVVLYEMSTGRRPFEGTSPLTTLTAILRDDPKPLLDVRADAPPGLQSVISRCLAKSADGRFQTIGEAIVALKDAPTVTMTAIPAVKPAAAATPAGGKKTGLIAAGVAAALIAGGGGWFALSRKTPQAPPPAVTAPVEEAKPKVLNNDGVIDMVKGKVSQELIAATIRDSRTEFDLSAPEIIRLTKEGVPDAVMQMMRNPAVAAAAAPPKKPDSPPPAAASQSTPAPPAPETPAAPAAAAPATIAVAVPDGTPLALVLTEDVSADADTGAVLKLAVARDLIVADHLVIAKGAVVHATVADLPKRRLKMVVGRGTMEIHSVNGVDGHKVKLRATRGSGRAELANKGKNKDLLSPAGTEYVAYVNGNAEVHAKR